LKKRIFILSLLIIFLTGCSIKEAPSTKEIYRSGIDLIVMEESSKVTYLKDNTTMEKFCASREIDSAQTFTQGVGLGISVGTLQDSISEQEGSGAVALGGRSPAVLITRELMFRACELALNLNLDSEKTIEIYKMFLDYTNKLIKNEHDQGSQTAVSQAVNGNTQINLKTTDNTEESNDDESDDDESDDDESDDEK
jgi:hypothetical protein